MDRGPRVVMFIELCFATLGLALAYVSVAGIITPVPFWGMSLIYLCMGIASGGCITGALVINGRNFLPEDRGKVSCY